MPGTDARDRGRVEGSSVDDAELLSDQVPPSTRLASGRRGATTRAESAGNASGSPITVRCGAAHGSHAVTNPAWAHRSQGGSDMWPGLSAALRGPGSGASTGRE